LQAAIVLYYRHIEIPLRTAFDGPIRWTQREHRRNGINHSNRLTAVVRVAAAILSHPNAGDDLGTNGGIGKRAIYEDTSQATIVLGHGVIKLPRRAALHRAIRRAEREDRRSRIDHYHRLAAIGGEPTAICDLPYASNVHRARAVGGGVENCERDIGSAASIRRARIIETPCRAAFDCLVGRANDRSRWTRRIRRRRHLERHAQRIALQVKQRVPRRRERRVTPDRDVVVVLIGRVPAKQLLRACGRLCANG